MKKVVNIFAAFLILVYNSYSQVSISADNSPPDSSAGLEVDFPDRGFLVPRMTFDQRNAIASPDEGLIIYCTNCGLDGAGTVCIWTNGFWSTVTPCKTESPVAGTHTTMPCGQIIWSWNTVTGAAGYKWSMENSYDSALDMETGTSKTEMGLQCGITYTRYAWAYSACGVSVPVTLSQSIPCHQCGQVLTDCRDNKTYNTVMIGTQCWMARNLNVGTLISGTSTQSDNGIIEKYCHSNYSSRCDVYGGLYQWGELMNYTSSSNSNPSGRQGICPSGWHLPSDAEWTQMTNFLGGASVAGGKMKDTGYSHWSSPNTGANNSSGFTAFGAGFRDSSGSFYNFHQDAGFWTSAESGSSDAWSWLLSYDSAGENHYSYAKTMGFSARCIKE